MKKRIVFMLFLLCGLGAQAQPRFINGNYDNGLHLVQLDKTHIKGYFESYTGMDETTGKPRFSCLFLFEGTFLDTDKYTVKTYYPFDTDTIHGELMVEDTNMVHLWLEQNPGGCWNVQPFADGWQTFMHEKKTPAINYGYVKSGKAYFHQSPDLKTKRKGYLLKGQFVQIEKIKGDFAYCVYEGEQVTKGWMLKKELAW